MAYGSVPITGGSGDKNLAADTISAVEFPRYKVVFGAEGSATDASAANPFPIEIIEEIPAGTQFIGKVGANDGTVEVTPTLDTGAYTSGDVLFDVVEIAGAARATGTSAILQSIVVLDKAKNSGAFDLVFLSTNTSIGTINTADDLTDLEGEDILGVISVAATDYIAFTNFSVATLNPIGLEMTAATTSIYVAALSRDTKTYAASDLVIKFSFLRS